MDGGLSQRRRLYDLPLLWEDLLPARTIMRGGVCPADGRAFTRMSLVDGNDDDSTAARLAELRVRCPVCSEAVEKRHLHLHMQVRAPPQRGASSMHTRIHSHHFVVHSSIWSIRVYTIYTHPFILEYARPPIHSPIQTHFLFISFISFISFIHPYIHTFIHSYIHTFISFIHSYIHSYCHRRTRWTSSKSRRRTSKSSAPSTSSAPSQSSA